MIKGPGPLTPQIMIQFDARMNLINNLGVRANHLLDFVIRASDYMI